MYEIYDNIGHIWHLGPLYVMSHRWMGWVLPIINGSCVTFFVNESCSKFDCGFSKIARTFKWMTVVTHWWQHTFECLERIYLWHFTHDHTNSPLSVSSFSQSTYHTILLPRSRERFGIAVSCKRIFDKFSYRTLLFSKLNRHHQHFSSLLQII